MNHVLPRPRSFRSKRSPPNCSQNRSACAASTEQKTRHVRLSCRTACAARTERKPTAEFVEYMVVVAHDLIAESRANLLRPFTADLVRAQFALATGHVLKSSGTSPNTLRITTSSNSPRSGLSIRANATAPAFASLRNIASALRITADECGHSTACPGTKPPFSKRTNGNAA